MQSCSSFQLLDENKALGAMLERANVQSDVHLKEVEDLIKSTGSVESGDSASSSQGISPARESITSSSPALESNMEKPRKTKSPARPPTGRGPQFVSGLKPVEPTKLPPFAEPFVPKARRRNLLTYVTAGSSMGQYACHVAYVWHMVRGMCAHGTWYHVHVVRYMWYRAHTVYAPYMYMHIPRLCRCSRGS